MDDRILSTNSSIPYLIKSGQVSQSPFSEAFIVSLKRKLNVDIVACYSQTREYNTFCKGKPTDDFVDEVLIFFYARESSLKVLQTEDSRRIIEAIFWDTVQSLGLQCSYTREFSQEESAYYGFANKPFKQCNMEKIKKPALPPRKCFLVKVEAFDYEALYFLLSNQVSSVGKYIRQTYGVDVNVYVGFLKASPYTPTHYIAFQTQKEYEHFLSLTCPDTVLAAIRENLKLHDKWNVSNNYCPRYCVWSQLSGEEKMCLLREAHD